MAILKLILWNKLPSNIIPLLNKHYLFVPVSNHTQTVDLPVWEISTRRPCVQTGSVDWPRTWKTYALNNGIINLFLICDLRRSAACCWAPWRKQVVVLSGGLWARNPSQCHGCLLITHANCGASSVKIWFLGFSSLAISKVISGHEMMQ